MARPGVIYRHSRAVRITHWGQCARAAGSPHERSANLQRPSRAHLGEKSDFDKPILAMRPMTHDKQIYGVTTVFGWDFDTTGLFGLGGNGETGFQERGLSLVGDASRPPQSVHGAPLALFLRLAVSLQRFSSGVSALSGEADNPHA